LYFKAREIQAQRVAQLSAEARSKGQVLVEIPARPRSSIDLFVRSRLSLVPSQMQRRGNTGKSLTLKHFPQGVIMVILGRWYLVSRTGGGLYAGDGGALYAGEPARITDSCIRSIAALLN